MGGGVSMPVDQAIAHITPRFEATPLSEAAKGVSGPILITGKVVLKKDAVTAPLCGKHSVYYETICDQLINNQKKATCVRESEQLDFELVDLHDPNVRVFVPFKHLKAHFLLMSDSRATDGASKPEDLDEKQLKFLRKHKFQPTTFAVFGMTMKHLRFTEHKIILDQPISMLCTVNNMWVGPVTDKEFADAKKWDDQGKVAWKTCFGKDAIVVTDRFKVPHKLATVVPMATIGVVPLHQQQHNVLAQPQQFHGLLPIMTQHQQVQPQHVGPYPQPMMTIQQPHPFHHSQQPMMMLQPHPQQAFNQQPMMMQPLPYPHHHANQQAMLVHPQSQQQNVNLQPLVQQPYQNFSPHHHHPH